MKRILFFVLFTLCVSCETEYYTKEILAEKALEALQKNDLELFKNVLIGYDYVKKDMDISEDKFDVLISNIFEMNKKEFTKMGYEASDFEIFKVSQNTKEYKLKDKEYVNYNVIIKNKDNIYLKLKFSDCMKTENGYKLGEAMRLYKYNN